MSTWWAPATRADLGLRPGDLPGTAFNLTNRGWAVFRDVLTALGAPGVEHLTDRNLYVPTSAAQQWGALILSHIHELDQLGRWDGRVVAYHGITSRTDAHRHATTCEITPLPDTPVGMWLASIGQHLATTPTGLAVIGQARKEHPMSVSLTKGGNVNLTKQAPGLTAVTVGLGWDVRTTTGADFDLDASAIVCGTDGKVLSDKNFVFFNNLTNPAGTVEHTGDNRTGTGTGDDEQIKVNLATLDAEATKVVFQVSIYDADGRGQSFGQVSNAFIRVVNQAGGAELARYDLSEDASTETAMIFGELYRHGGEWKFRAVGQGYASGLAGIASDYGVNV
jgi:tellurium resistance protein TerD